MERIAFAVGVVSYGRGDEVCAVGCDHACLGKTGTRIGILDGGVYANKGDEDAEGEVEGDEELVEGAS